LIDLPQLRQSVIPFVAANYRWLAGVLITLVLLNGMRRADDSIRAELNLALQTASAHVGPLLRGYAATEAFSDDEILQLSKNELQRAAELSKASISPRLSLQAIGLQQKVLYDSRLDHIQRYEGKPGTRVLIAFIRQPESVRRTELVVAEGWTLRAVVNRKDYFAMVAWRLIPTILVCGIVFLLCLFPRYYEESVLGKRRFEALIGVVLKNPAALSDEDDFVVHLPEFVRQVLEFDSVAVYWKTGDGIFLRAVDSADTIDRAALELNSISIDDHEAEKQAVMEHRAVVVKRRGWRRDVYIAEPEGFRDATYIIAPIYDRMNRQVLGVLTAERRHGLQTGDKDTLYNLARLIMILIEAGRSTTQKEQDYQHMIILTRQVAMGQVVPVVAHNLRTPLSMVSILARQLERKWPDMAPEKINKALSQIETQTERSLMLLKTLLDYRMIGVQPSAGAASPATDLYDVLEKICGFFEAYLRMRRIHLERRFQPDYRPRVKLNAGDLQQVITNLLINADQALAEDQRATTEKKIEVEVAAAEDPDGVLIRIRDNGPGVPAAHRSLIFEEDFTTKRDGTGAGLPHSRKVIRAAGGTFELEQISGSGASFKIYLPTIQGDQA
jgi:signal transduction histidine kinase